MGKEIDSPVRRIIRRELIRMRPDLVRQNPGRLNIAAIVVEKTAEDKREQRKQSN